MSFPATEFTLAPYMEGSEFGFGRGTQYCMLTLKHELVTADHHKNLQLYVRKQELWRSRVEEVFGLYDSDSSGHLDAQQVTEAMDGIGLPANDERVAGVLARYAGNANNFWRDSDDKVLTLPDFAELLEATWGRGVSVDYSDGLSTVWTAGDEAGPGVAPLFFEAPGEVTRAVVFLGRAPPVHVMLRVLRWTWPLTVESVAVLRNARDNPSLDPRHLVLFDETYEPSVDEESGATNIVRLARLAAQFDPVKEGGFVVRIDQRATLDDRGHEVAPAETVYVPLRGLPENPPGTTALKPDVDSTEMSLRMGWNPIMVPSMLVNFFIGKS